MLSPLSFPRTPLFTSSEYITRISNSTTQVYPPSSHTRTKETYSQTSHISSTKSQMIRSSILGHWRPSFASTKCCKRITISTFASLLHRGSFCLLVFRSDERPADARLLAQRYLISCAGVYGLSGLLCGYCFTSSHVMRICRIPNHSLTLCTLLPPTFLSFLFPLLSRRVFGALLSG